MEKSRVAQSVDLCALGLGRGETARFQNEREPETQAFGPSPGLFLGHSFFFSAAVLEEQTEAAG